MAKSLFCISSVMIVFISVLLLSKFEDSIYQITKYRLIMPLSTVFTDYAYPGDHANHAR